MEERVQPHVFSHEKPRTFLVHINVPVLPIPRLCEKELQEHDVLHIFFVMVIQTALLNSVGIGVVNVHF